MIPKGPSRRERMYLSCIGSSYLALPGVGNFTLAMQAMKARPIDSWLHTQDCNVSPIVWEKDLTNLRSSVPIQISHSQ